MAPTDVPPADDARSSLEESLLAAARAARRAAYAPYTGTRIGAALATSDGRVFTGATVENSSPALGMCAERVATAAAVAAGAREPVALAVVSDGEEPPQPCGACRQFLIELVADLPVVAEGAGRRRLATRLAELLPEAFRPGDLDAPRRG